MKALVTFLSLMAISLTASADPMNEKLALSCVLDDGQTMITKEVKLSQAKTEDGLIKTAALAASSGGADFHINVMGNRISINTISSGMAIGSEGRDSAALQLMKEGAESMFVTVECKLK